MHNAHLQQGWDDQHSPSTLVALILALLPFWILFIWPFQIFSSWKTAVYIYISKTITCQCSLYSSELTLKTVILSKRKSEKHHVNAV